MHLASPSTKISIMLNPQSLVLLLAVGVAVAGCRQPEPASPPSAVVPPATATADSPLAAAQPALGKPSVAPGNAAPQDPVARLALDGEGLRIFITATGASRAIPFGIAKADALRMLETVQGAPPETQGKNIDCGATNAVWPDGLTVWFARDKFVGWSLASAGSPLSTAGGLNMGTTRAELENGASVASIARSSLGEEFNAGGVAGLLDSAAADARVTHLWAGATCIAR